MSQLQRGGTHSLLCGCLRGEAAALRQPLPFALGSQRARIRCSSPGSRGVGRASVGENRTAGERGEVTADTADSTRA